jgi:hypothetical protein
MIYTHVLNRAGTRGVRSPADALWRSIPRASPDTRQLLPQPNFLPGEIPPSRQLEAGEHFGDDQEDSDEDF